MAQYDIIVIGAGAAGLVSSKLTHGLGKKTALIEKRHIGGDCTWYGCIPSKTLIKSAHVSHQLEHLDTFGLTPLTDITINTDKVMDHVRTVVEADAAGHAADDIKAEGIDFFSGEAQFIDNRSIQVGEQRLTAKRVIIATGSHPAIPDIEGLEEIPYLTNETVFSLKTLPRRLIVLGAGPIGVELAAALNRLHVDVTLVQRSEHFLKKDDKELVDQLKAILEDEGLRILLNTIPLDFSRDGETIRLEVKDSLGRRTLEADAVLVATGRRPSLQTLALDKAGVAYDTNGIQVDKHLRTTSKNIWACGDVVSPYLFTHMSEYEAVIAGTNAAFGLPIKKTNYDHILWATYTEPELAHAGLTEEQARERYGDSIQIYRWDYHHVDRARTDVTDTGLGKFIVNKQGKLLGIHILGQRATELMHEAQVVKTLGLPFSKIASVIHAYPSYSDLVRQPAKKALIDGLHRKLKQVKSGAILLLLVILIFLLQNILPVKAWFVQGLEWVEGLGVWAPVFVALFYIIACVLFLPGSVLTLGAGFLFGVIKGTLIVSIGSTLGACAAFLVGRTIARDRIAKKIEGNKKFAAIDEAVGKEGWKIVLLTRLSPVFPFNLLNYAYGLTKVSFKHYALASWIGMLPGTVMYVYFGDGLSTLAKAATGVDTGVAGKLFFWIGLVIAVIVAVFVARMAKKTLDVTVTESSSH